MLQGAWVLSKARAEKAEYILAVKKGIIVEVVFWPISGWKRQRKFP